MGQAWSVEKLPELDGVDDLGGIYLPLPSQVLDRCALRFRETFKFPTAGAEVAVRLKSFIHNGEDGGSFADQDNKAKEIPLSKAAVVLQDGMLDEEELSQLLLRIICAEAPGSDESVMDWCEQASQDGFDENGEKVLEMKKTFTYIGPIALGCPQMQLDILIVKQLLDFSSRYGVVLGVAIVLATLPTGKLKRNRVPTFKQHETKAANVAVSLPPTIRRTSSNDSSDSPQGTCSDRARVSMSNKRIRHKKPSPTPSSSEGVCESPIKTATGSKVPDDHKRLLIHIRKAHDVNWQGTAKMMNRVTGRANNYIAWECLFRGAKKRGFVASNELCPRCNGDPDEFGVGDDDDDGAVPSDIGSSGGASA